MKRTLDTILNYENNRSYKFAKLLKDFKELHYFTKAIIFVSPKSTFRFAGLEQRIIRSIQQLRDIAFELDLALPGEVMAGSKSALERYKACVALLRAYQRRYQTACKNFHEYLKK